MPQQLTPEQQEELRKKLENMSPEELREFQKKQCIFCHIVSGKVQSRKVYEDDRVIAVLDINPGNPGHVLLMPKEHYTIMPQLPENELKHIFIIAKQLSNALLKSLDARGTNIIVANGPAAGQKAQHFMIHIIPRKEGDGVNFKLPSTQHNEDDLDKVNQAVRKRLNQLMGIKEEEQRAEEIIKQSKARKVVDAEEKESKEEAEEPKKSEEEQEGKEEEQESESKGGREPEEEKKENEDSGSDIDLDAISRVLNG
ncbi:HIT domain-containing protein [Candidatus Woesearchaeota archaeon]|nr:HIT domain-containing protein [Candidatus Woesearchaeota archaeon]